MPTLPPRIPAQPPFKLVFGAAAGLSPSDFYVLGYCHDLDEQEITQSSNYEHQQFTHLARFTSGQRSIVACLPERLDGLWAAPSGVVLGVGWPRGVIEIQGTKVSQVGITDIPGTFATIWGTNDNHLFACGNYSPFWLCRDHGVWRNLPLPPDTPGLWCAKGLSETDVYAVGMGGAILHFDGQAVHMLESPTTRWLTSIAPLAGGLVYIGGYEGTLLCGNHRGWRHLHTDTDAPLLSVVPYRNGVCFLTPDGLWWTDSQQPAPTLLVRQGGRWLNAIGDDTLMIVNGEEAWLFDGHQLISLDTSL